ncbi:RNA dependent RNA polymerase [Ureibacillus chungkukjangi]|uniref:RNA dependent RNA polymerase n=1 Tax=Ureibacillus chungkukjangi TaxID=1202712 RepID=UPI00203A85E2|nr:RNA dependent RNA polymerase [Ureibacillus chungkukjangi]MCM3387311.1 RNA dependent RNA polymerase [Ureibacillus chungkukjangi]
MIKLQQYYVLKLTTSRLQESNFNITITPPQARLNGELVQIGDNQVFRLIRKLTNKEIDFTTLNVLFNKRNNLKQLESSEENSNEIAKLQQQIDDNLFIPHIVNIKVDDKKIYKEIFKNGFTVNGITFKRFCSGAGQSRQSIATFTNVELIEELNRRLNCGLSIKEINVAKYNAYFGLYMSATYPVRKPRVCVIDDCETDKYTINKKVDWIQDIDHKDESGKIIKSERTIYEKDDFHFVPNMFDGQGLISPTFVAQWQEDLELDYLPSEFILRSSFIKGAVVTFDFHRFAKEVAKTDKITDIYGNTWNINEVDILLSKSQFKMHKFYKSWSEFTQLQEHHGLTWGVTKANAKRDNEMSLLNYQYIQTLNLDKEKIQQLIQPTIDWIERICNGDKLYTLLFLLGSSKENDSVSKIFNKTNSNFVKAVLYNDKLLNDPYIKKKLYENISVKIDEAKIGRLWSRGNYQFMVSDPYAQAQFAFGLEVTGLLKEKEYYSNFWNERSVTKVDACRSPMVDFHEHNIIDFVADDIMNHWYKYLKSGIIYNVWDVDTIRHSDSDWDGDIVFTTDNEIILNNIIPNLNVITYEKATAKPQKLNGTNILSTDLRSFNSKIGAITNYSTTFISMLANFEKDSEGYNELIKRIKLLRRYIGDSIDQAKGIKTKPFPSEWKKRVFVDKNEAEDVKKEKYYHNSLVANKKPYFMIYIYDKLRAEYREHKRKCDRTCKEKFGCNLNQLMNKSDKTKEEIYFINTYYRNMPVIKNNSIMNTLCKMIEEVDFKHKKSKNNENIDEIYAILSDFSIKIDESKLEKLLELRKKFNKKRNFKYKNNAISSLNTDSDGEVRQEDIINEFYEEIRNEAYSICSNAKELANHLIFIDYKLHPNDPKDFTWHIGVDGMLEILEAKSDMNIEMPMKDNDGEYYLGEKYSLRGVVI